MRILITGICGFVGSRLANFLIDSLEGLHLFGIDNLVRPGSEMNLEFLRHLGVQVLHGDLRMASDVNALPKVDWVIDAAANPSVLAGVDGKSSSRQLLEHNLLGTINLLEYCRSCIAGLVLLSSSRVYSIDPLAHLPVLPRREAFELNTSAASCQGVSAAGLSEAFPVEPPLSLYGSTKRASELLAIEYSATFGFPAWIIRCGVLAGAGQFGTAEQGIFSYWLHAHAARLPLRYIGFGGRGYQVRDAFHPVDLGILICKQIQHHIQTGSCILNAGGGASNAMSLAQLTAWCNDRFGTHTPSSDLSDRRFDVPWLVMDSTRANTEFGWNITHTLPSILDEIAEHVETHPDWLRRCAVI
ncbi:MAG TPA: NAD-dependent epimerase/dehydratase family protein [Bryobacteraceae bacterium]|nr:NAD-dependent epimerase/dehydratase family protein [Bryobacteraceae bacterium]